MNDKNPLDVKLIPGPARNPLFPLPPDYNELDEEGQRQARVNACRLWTHRGDKDYRTLAMVGGLRFFDKWYLQDDPDDGFVSEFYGVGEWLPPPAFHDKLTSSLAANKYTVCSAPRGSAKSFWQKKVMKMLALSCPMYAVQYVTSTNDLASKVGESVRHQFKVNERIAKDWDREMRSGRVWPKRGDAPQGESRFVLGNRSSVDCVSVEGKVRGVRPTLLLIDDAEGDGRTPGSVDRMIEQFRHTLLSVLMPAASKHRSSIFLLGTILSSRHFLNRILEVETVVENGEVVQRSVEEKFHKWYKLQVSAIEHDADGNPRSCWPQMWPLDREDARRQGLSDDIETLEDKKVAMGPRAFAAEMLGKPTNVQDSLFGEVTQERHSWWLENVDAESAVNPLASEAMICWNRFHRNKEMERIQLPLKQFVARYRMAVVCDPSFTANQTSDRAAVAVVAKTEHNELFVLDGWSAIADTGTQVQRAIAMGKKWACRNIHPELNGSGSVLEQALRDEATVLSAGGASYVPRVVGFRSDWRSKTERIAGMEPMWCAGLVKLPWDRRNENGFVGRLVEQVEGFNPEALHGGLKRDDEIDAAFTMHRHVLKGRAYVKADEDKEAPETPAEMAEKVRQGIFVDEKGRDLVGSLSPMGLDYLMGLAEQRLFVPETQDEPNRG